MLEFIGQAIEIPFRKDVGDGWHRDFVDVGYTFHAKVYSNEVGEFDLHFQTLSDQIGLYYKGTLKKIS